MTVRMQLHFLKFFLLKDENDAKEWSDFFVNYISDIKLRNKSTLWQNFYPFVISHVF